MKQLEVFNKIGGIIKELNDQYKYIETNPENINDLELELFVANAHFLTDHAEILSKLSQRNKAENLKSHPADAIGTRGDTLAKQAEQTIAQPERKPIDEKPAEIKPIEKPVEAKKEAEPEENAISFTQPKFTAEKFFEPVVQQPKRDLKRIELADTTAKEDEPAPQIDLSSDTPKDSYSFIMEEPEVIRHELVVENDNDTEEELPEEIVDDAPVEEEDEIVEEKAEAIKEPEPVKETPKPVVKAEEVKDKEEVLTINQRMSSQRGGAANVTEQAGAQPVTNLKAAITLNDKLLYIKDLFNGYSLAYSEAIEILNRFNTFEEANRFLNKNYTLKNNWDSKPETADKFFALLKRRYS